MGTRLSTLPNSSPMWAAFCVLLALSLSWHSNVNAQSGNWTGDGDGISWDDPANWDGNQVPSGAGNSASIPEDNSFNGFDVEVNVATAIENTNLGRSNSLSINADLQTNLDLSGSTLNLNSGTLTGRVAIEDTQAGGVTINRNGGLLDLDGVSVFDNSVNLTIVAGDMVRSALYDESSGSGVLNVNGGEIERLNHLNGVVNINSGTVSENTNIYGGVLNLNGGTISGDLSLDPFFVTPQFNQNGGTLDLDNLSLDFVPGGGQRLPLDRETT